MGRFLGTFLCFFVFASGAWASCVEHAVLRDTDYFSSRYKWSNGKVEIKIWDSPSMIRIVGILTPGAHVKVLDKDRNFMKVRAPEEQGGQIGWVSFALVELTFQQPVEGSGAECGVAVAIEPEPEKAVKTARERKAEGTSLQALTSVEGAEDTAVE
ncbi:MAG TPA: hypothetical protein VI728_13335 [Syntrophales bacterium]|nr:hypothetical protein [Syntrophales bacterium]